MRRVLCRGALAALVAVMPVAAATAQGTASVAPSDLVYRDVDRLVAIGLLDSVIVGQRPYSRRELARIAAAARDQLARGSRQGEAIPHDADAIVARLVARFVPDSTTMGGATPVVSLLDGASVGGTATDAVRRGFVAPNTARLEATIDPLASPRRLGQPSPSGQSATLEIAQRVEPSSWFAVHARERIELDRRDGSLVHGGHDELLQAGARLRFANLAIDAGREQFAWSQGASDGLFIAADAPALDQVSLSGDHPFLLPGWSKLLGPTQATLLLADLGPSAVRSHSKLLAYKVSVHPRSSLELGATFLNHFGGSGGRSSSLGSHLIDFLPFVDIFRRHNYTDSTRALDVESDKLLGVDGRWRIARLGGLLVAGEMLIDDFDVHRLPTMFGWDGSQTFAVTLPSVARSPLSLRVAATHMGVRTYTHATLTNGITTRGRLIGDELGPDAKAFDLGATWNGSGRTRFALDGRTALYSLSDYTSLDRNGTLLLQRKGRVVNELRDQLLASMEVSETERISLVVRAGGERIRNADFVPGTRHSYLVDVSLRLAR
ncbi:MAG: capsule assembly Wzi family protein [Gemmatimonadales bacterium]